MDIKKETIELFEFVPPDKLRKTIQEIYFGFVNSCEDIDTIKEVSEELYFLINYLNKVEDIIKKKP
jgi:hypothetical protein